MHYLRKVCFGQAIGQVCSHHFHTRHRHCTTTPSLDQESGKPVMVDTGGEQEWKWIGARWREIGFLASVIQYFAATVFWISTVTGIPGVIDMNDLGLTDGIFWVPQVIGGSGFVISRYLARISFSPLSPLSPFTRSRILHPTPCHFTIPHPCQYPPSLVLS